MSSRSFVLAIALAGVRTPAPRLAPEGRGLDWRAPDGTGVVVEIAPSREKTDRLVVLVGVARAGDHAANAPSPTAKRGLLVAKLTCALGDEHPIGRCTAEVAQAVRAIASRTRAPSVTLVGLGLGASIAMLVALEPEPKVSGVVGIAGTYDFSERALDQNPDASLLFTGAKDVAALAASGPIAKVRSSPPPILLLTPGDDDPSVARDAHAFAKSLERQRASFVQHWMVPGRSRTSIANDEDVASLLSEPVSAEQPIDGPWGIKRRWSQATPIDPAAFWADESIVVTRPVSGLFHVALAPIFADHMIELSPLPLREYHAIPLAKYLASRGAPSGEHVIVTNIRGERLTIAVADLEKHEPEIVIGIDDERNLYRLFTSYRLLRESSKEQPKTPLPRMIRPLGPFLFFPRGAPDPGDATTASFSLTPESFQVKTGDPFAAVRGQPAGVSDALLGPNGCLKCHTLRGAGARAHHVRAADAQAHGGYALGLDEYPHDVLRRFLFDQDAVAASFGVEPLRVPEPTAKALYDLVTSK
jgi:pimeloyl-ACP methyl ester carboxylesterase